MLSEVWTKSPQSAANGQCVEAKLFRKSPFSGAQGDCVEVADAACGVHVRDSKNPDGPQLTFNAGEWAAFVGGVKAGHFDMPTVP